MLSKGRTKLCIVKGTRPQREPSVLLQRAGRPQRDGERAWTGSGQGRNLRTWQLLEVRERGTVMTPSFLTKAQVMPTLWTGLSIHRPQCLYAGLQVNHRVWALMPSRPGEQAVCRDVTFTSRHDISVFTLHFSGR